MEPFTSDSIGSSSFTLGDTLCAALVPFVAIVESLIFLFCDCFNQHSSRSGGRRQQAYDSEKLARDSRCFSVNDVEALYELYKKLSNSIIKDGLIHKEELQLALLHTVTDENLFLNRIFDVFDEKKNGVIEFEEFIHALSIFHPQTHLEEKIEFTFRLYDLQQTGFIEREEVKQMLIAILGESNVALPENLIEAILDTTFEEADTDRDARINRQEWREYVMRHPSLLKNMTLPYLKDITTAFPSFIFNTEVDD